MPTDNAVAREIRSIQAAGPEILAYRKALGVHDSALAEGQMGDASTALHEIAMIEHAVKDRNYPIIVMYLMSAYLAEAELTSSGTGSLQPLSRPNRAVERIFQPDINDFNQEVERAGNVSDLLRFVHKTTVDANFPGNIVRGQKNKLEVFALNHGALNIYAKIAVDEYKDTYPTAAQRAVSFLAFIDMTQKLCETVKSNQVTDEYLHYVKEVMDAYIPRYNDNETQQKIVILSKILGALQLGERSYRFEPTTTQNAKLQLLGDDAYKLYDEYRKQFNPRLPFGAIKDGWLYTLVRQLLAEDDEYAKANAHFIGFPRPSVKDLV